MVEIGARAIGARRPAGRGSADPHRAGPLRRRRRAARHAARRVPAQHRAARAPGSVDVSEARALPGCRRGLHGRRHGAPHRTPPRRAALIGMNLMPGMKVPPSTRSRPTRSATSATRSPWSSPRAATSPRTRSSSSSRTSSCSTPSSRTTTPWIPAKPPLFDEFDDNLAFSSEHEIGDIDAAFAKADRVVAASSGSTATSPCRWSAAGSIADWDARRRAAHDPRRRRSRRTCCRMLLPPQINVPMEKIRVLADDVGGGFGLKNGVHREDVAVVAASIDLGRPVKWIEDRLEHLASAGRRARRWPTIEAAVTARRRDARRAHGRDPEPRRLPLRPVPRRDVRRAR